MTDRITHLEAGTPIIYGGDRVTYVGDELAGAFEDGDRLVVVHDTGDLLHIPASDWEAATSAVDLTADAFIEMATATHNQITAFYERFAARLSDDHTFAAIADANRADLARAQQSGRSTTRLALTEKMRNDMLEGLHAWAAADASTEVVEKIGHSGWELHLIRAPLGVVGFVFEGRPNVVADATGLLRGGNTVVFRIGSDALATAAAIMDHALTPSLVESGLPAGAVSLIRARSRAAGWALFSDRRLGLAVARGSGAAVTQLGAVARQTGIPVSLHGTGGAWIITGQDAAPEPFGAAVLHSLDRKVCNTLNTAVILEHRAEELIPVFLESLQAAASRRDTNPKLHVTATAAPHVPPSWYETTVINRAQGEVMEAKTEPLLDDQLGREWEWEDSPEVSLTLAPDVSTAVQWFNLYSPRFIASLISTDPGEQEEFFKTIDAPFVGNGFTRWVDGQYALDQPELGLANWQGGRLFGRGGILTGESVYTIRTRVIQEDPDIHR